MFELSQNGPLIRGVIKEFIFSKIAWSPKSSTREAVIAARKATQMEDFGLQAILEKMNSLITPLISGPLWDISNIFQNFFDIFSKFVKTKNSIESDFSTPRCLEVTSMTTQDSHVVGTRHLKRPDGSCALRKGWRRHRCVAGSLSCVPVECFSRF